MNVLLAPKEVAGQIGIISKTLRSKGINALSVILDSPNPLRYSVDKEFYTSRFRLLRWAQKIVFIFIALYKFDVVHLQGGAAFQGNFDLILLKIMGRKVVVTYHGSDIRNREYLLAIARGSAKIPAISTPIQQKQIHRVLFTTSRITVTTADLTKIVPVADFIPCTVDEKWFSNYKLRSSCKGRIRIIHAPTHREIKGTNYIIETVRRLNKEGFDLELILVENVPNHECLDIYLTADLVIDQLIIGWYGVFAIENMALGNPVLCNLDQDLIRKYVPECPIINANKETLYAELRSFLYLTQEELLSLRLKTRKYAELVHHPNVISDRYINLYSRESEKDDHFPTGLVK